ncbi:MAG: trimeric autotransporter adhesin, partial [Sphingomonadales bacterium]|nr:trimeric autotransporter adhesin [Sphingomonadales bacterium]
MARDRNIARNSARINPESEDGLGAGDAHNLARLPAPDGPGPNALPTTLSAGQIAFTAFQSDNTGGAGGDYFQFVLLTAVNAGTTIYFTDSGSRTDNFRFRTNEQVLRWVAQSDLPAGTLVSFTATGGAGVTNTAEWTGINPITGGVASNAQLALGAGGDNITAFVSPVFAGSDNLGGTAIAALAFGQATFSTTYNTSGPTTQTGLPGGLTDGVNAVSIAPTDNGRYTGTTSGTASALRSAFNTDTNWTTDVNPLSPHGVAAVTVLNPGMLSVNDVTLAEGNSGTTNFVFTITRTGGSDGAVGATWTLTTFFGGNVDAADFVTYPQSGTVSFANGETSRQITIQVQGDTIVEPDEAFTVTLSAPTGGVTTSNIGVGRILNDDVTTISIDDISHSEGDSGSTVYTFTVTRSGGSSGAVGATWTIAFPGGAGGANSGDLAAGQSLTGTVSFASGETSKTIIVNVAGDYFIESDETFTVTLSAPTGGATISDATGIGTIANDDVAGAISIDDVSHSEGDGGTTLYTFTVSRTGQAANASVQWALGGDAGATDFPTSQALSGTITFAGGETSRTITISVLGDHLHEPDESFTVILSNPSAGATIADGTGIGTILTDDTAPPFTPDGNEVTVNQNIDQDQVGPRVAWIDAGHYVVTWTSHETPTSYEVMARLFNGDGTPAGDEFQVNTTSAGDQVGNRVAALSGGGFVIVWSDVTTTDIRAQMFNADGSPDGTELLLNTDPNAQSVPWVSALPGGGFAAVWMHDDGVSYDIRGRTFDADGQPVSAEFAVNTNTALNQQYAQMTTLANGHFVVVWHDSGGIGGDASSTAIKMRVFDTDGTALTDEILANTTIAGMQQFPAVGALVGGGYVVAWEDYSASGGDTSGNALRAQIYDASGNAVGGEFIVNFTTEGDQSRPTIAGLPDGGFVIGWWNQADGVSVNEIRAQAFDALGNRRGGEFEVNSDSAGDQLGASFAVSANGHLVATWTDFNDSQELTDGEIEQRLFTLDLPPGSLSVGNLVFLDANNNGVFDAGDSGIDGITVQLYHANGSAAATTVTAGGGLYSFTGLAEGDYYLLIDAAELPPGLVSVPTATDPDDDVDNDNNGVYGPIIGTTVFTLTAGGEPDTAVDGNGTDANFTVDFGFAYAPPTIDLDLSSGGTGYAASFTEGAPGIAIVDSDVTITSATPITSITIKLTDHAAGDSLFVGAIAFEGGDLQSSAYDSSTGTITIFGTGTIAEWQQALTVLRYRNTTDNPTLDDTDTQRSISFVVNSGGSASEPATMTADIIAINEPATIGGTATGDVTEDGSDNTGSQITISDPDSPDTFVPIDAGSGTAGLGTFNLTEDGYWSYFVNNAMIQYLGAGASTIDTIEAVAADGTMRTLTVTIHGVADAPEIDGTFSGAVTEDSATPATGQLTISDADQGEAVFNPMTNYATAHGIFSIDASGNWSYALDDARDDHLPAGAQTTDTITISSADGTTRDIAITIIGVNDTAAILGDILGDVTEDTAPSDSGALSASDADDGESQFFEQSLAIGGYGTFTLTSSGEWTYTLFTGAAQALGAGDVDVELFQVTTLGGDVETVKINVHGANDAPLFGGESTGSVTEDGATGDSGTLTINDVDNGESSFQAQGSIATAYGTFSIDADGNWSYSLNNGHPDVQALNDGQALTETIPVFTFDGTKTHVVITINGADEPLAVPPSVDLDGGTTGIDYDGSFTEGSATGIGVSIQVTQGTFPITGATVTLTDGLAGDSLTIVGALPPGITNISGSDQQIQLVGLGISAAEWAAALAQIVFASSSDNPDNYGTDTARTINVEVSDGFTVGATATATIAIDAVNDAPAVGALDGDSVTWTEGDPYVLLDHNMPVTVSDPDNQNFAGGFVSFGVQVNPRAEDEFFILDIIPSVGTNGDDVYVYGTHIGTITSSGAGEILTISFNANATAERVATLIDHIGYRNNAGDVPTAGARSVTYLLNDGHGGASGGVVTLDVVAVNDGPIVADTNIAIVEDQIWVLSLADFDIVDPEGDAIATIMISGATGGLIYYDADGAGAGEPVAITLYPHTFSFGDIAAGRLSWVPEAGVSGDDSSYFQYGVTDDRGAASAGARVYFDIATVIDAPTVDLNGPDEADTFFEAAYGEGGAGAAIADSDVAITSESGGLTGATITITDAAAGDLLSVAGTLPGLITALYDPGTATLTLSGEGTVAQYQAALAQIRYSSTSEDPDAAGTDTQRTIEIVVTDGFVEGAPSSAPVYAYVAVTGEIDNPAIGNLDGDLATYSEGDAFVLLDTGGDATVADLDNADFSGGTLTVSFNGTGLSQDRFDVASNDRVSLTPGSVVVDGVTIGSWDGGFPGGDFTVSLNGNATPDRVEVLLRALAYRNGAGDTPTAGLREVLITLTDGDGGTVSTASQVEVAAVNDPPTLGANAGLTLAEGATATITAAMLDFNDVEQADSAITYTLTGAAANGVLLLNGSVLGVGGSFTQAQVNGGLVSFQHDGGEAASAGFAFSVSDGAGGLVAGQSFAVAVTPVNDAPVVTTTAGTTPYVESVNTAPGTVAVNPALTVTDADDIALLGAQVSITGNYQIGQDILAFTNNNATAFGNISASYNAGTGVLTLTSPGVTATLAQWQAALRAVTYSNSSEEPNQANRTISFMVHDGDVWSAAATRLLSVTAQNDSPSGANSTVSINEDSAFTFTAAHFGFSDVDGHAFAGVRFGAAPAGGTLYFDADGAGGAAAVAVTSFPTTTYSAADIAAGKLTFVPTANLNGTGAASVGFTVIDNGGTAGAGQNADTIPNTLSFDIVSINDAPAGADKQISIDEDAAYTLTVADFGYSDVDGNAFEAVIFSNSVAGGTLYINGNPMTNVTLVYLHTIQSGGVVFVPAANATGPVGSLTFTVRDDGGFANGGQAADTTPNTLTFSMTPVNDAPVNSLPGPQSINEDASVTLSTGNGNALSVADVDATTLTVTLSVAHGTLTLASIAGLSFSGGSDGTADASMTFSGTATAINAALGSGLTYNPNANFNGSDAISFTTTDGGQTGSGPVGTDSDTITIAIAAVNDAPAGTSNVFTVNEDSTFTFAEAHFGFTDPVEGDDFLGVVIATIPAAGTLLLDGVAVTAGQFVSLHDIALGKLTFAPAADASGTPYGSFTFQVRDDGGTGNGGQDTDQSPNTVTFSVTAVNDAPTNNVPGGQTINEDASLTLSTGNGNAISVADVDATTLTVTLSVAHGTLTLASIAGLSFSGGSDGTADASMTFSGTPAAINAALGSGLTYNPTADFNGSDAISVVTTDGGQTGTGPVGTDSDSIAIGITAINDAPSGTSATIALNEDGARVLTQADFGFSDPAEGHGFAGVVITTLPANGTLLLNGAALLVAETFVTAAQLAAGQLVFQPDANENGAAYATLSFQVRDDGGTGNGGQDTDQSPNTLTFAVTAVNDSPVVDLNGAGAGTSAILDYSENGAAAPIAPGGAIIDVDTTDFGGGSLWVTITNGLNAEDMLSVLNQGTGAGQVGYANGLITYEGVTIADLLPTLGFPVPVLDIRFRSNVAVSPAAAQAVLQAVAYHNISQDPSTTPRTVTFTFNDGDGNPAGGDPPGNATATINLTSLNDAPSGTSATITIDEDGSRVLTQADFGFSDPAEGDAFTGVLLTSLPANGTLLLNGVAVAAAGIFVTAAQLAASQLVFAPAPNGNGSGYASFNFAVRDDGGTANGGLDTDQSPNTLTFNVTAINDAPAGADAHIVMNEDVGRVLTAADFGFGDTADGNAFAGVVLTSLPTAGFLIYDSDGAGGLPGVFANVGRFITAAELAMGALTYYPASHAYGAASASFTFQVRDTGGTGNGGQDTDQSPNTITFDINPVNDAPSGADKSITGSEDDPYVFTAADFGYGDPVEGNAFFAVRITTLPGAGDILLNGVAVMAGDFIAVSAINAGMLTFQPDPNGFGAPYASFTFQVQDDGGTANGGVDTDQSPNTITVTVTPDNLAPVLDLDSGTAGVDASLAYTENNPATRISPAATLTDASPDFAGGTITAHFAANGAAEDRLSIVGGNGIAVSSTDDTLFYGGVLIGSWGGGANGADLVVQFNANAAAAAVEAVLRAIAYANLSDNPSVLARTIAVAVTDGDGGAASALVTVNLTAVDDAAVARGDAFAIAETAVLSSNVFLDHGFGADGDVDGPGLAVSAVNGSSAHVGQQIQLASGALLTLNADGSFTYATNHAFDPTPAGSSGASNTSAADHFSYTLAGGGTATVTLAIAGLDSDDTLLGSAGADVLAGGNGNDSYRVENAADLVLESVGGGQDGVYVAMNLGAYALAAGAEVEILSAIDPASAAAMDLTGNEFANILIGTAGSNTLIGGGGADILIGGGGNDYYRVEEAGDAVVEGAGGGFDSVYAVGNYTLAAGSEVELLSAIDPASNAAMNLTGNEFANLIYGNAAGNTLIGGAGNDTLFGGAGNDFYRVETAGDMVVEYAGGGFDSVYAVESYTLAAGSEIELLSAIDPASTVAMNLTGNDFANLIYGNAGVNTLIGGGGADTLIGGLGNDFYRVEDAGDVVVEAAGGGADSVYAVTSYALNAGAEVELLSAIDPNSGGAMDLTGNDFANTIIGTAGANTLIGGGGNDVLAGGLGNDVYRVEDAGDVVLEYAGGGADAVYAVGSYTLQDGYAIEVLSAIDPNATGGINLTGNDQSNTIFG